jgi:hypothetical protein
MLTKDLDAEQASTTAKRVRKRAPTSAASPPNTLNEPQADWVRLWEAPFHCTFNGYISSEEKWAGVFATELETIIPRLELEPPNPEFSDLKKIPPVEWSVKQGTKNDAWGFDACVLISAGGICMGIMPGHIYLVPEHIEYFDHEYFDYWLIDGSSNTILEDPDWEDVPPRERLAAQWHKCVLAKLFHIWHSNYVNAVKSGTAQIMARKNTVLAPFERITWDQWQFFTLHDPPLLPQHIAKRWGDPRRDWSEGERIFSAATGPANEWLYDLHIAPGASSSEINPGNDPEEHCFQWLAELIRDYPDRPPKSRDLLARDAMAKFPGARRSAIKRMMPPMRGSVNC